MARYYFHCTDGTSLFLDRRGRLARTTRAMERAARETAAALMDDNPTVDWRGWLVSVHDQCGRQVHVIPLEELERAPSFVPIVARSLCGPVGDLMKSMCTTSCRPAR